MKGIFWFIIAAILSFGCSTSSKMLGVSDKNLIDISRDKDEYEIIVMDPGFDTWFATTWSPAKDRSVEYYSLWNQRYVSEWNYKVTNPHTTELFNNMIQYDPAADYGIEVERVLYYYFRWVDTKLGIPILNSRPPGGVL
jgi:hypothetical protein